MQVDVYSEELINRTTLVTSSEVTAQNPPTGVRLFLRSPNALHDDNAMDDRSSVTFWFESPAEAQQFFVKVAADIAGYFTTNSGRLDGMRLG